jgi:hypothetical protein
MPGTEVAGERPLLCVVDDAQWLDRASAQALAFAARRLLAEPVALLFATREPAEEFTGLPELLVQGLEDTDARALLGEVLRVRLDERVFDRIVAETWGKQYQEAKARSLTTASTQTPPGGPHDRSTRHALRDPPRLGTRPGDHCPGDGRTGPAHGLIEVLVQRERR